MNRVGLSLLCLAAAARAQTTVPGPVASGLLGTPGSLFSATDPPYALQITYPNASPSDPLMFVNNERLVRTALGSNQATFSVGPNSAAYSQMRTGNFRVSHAQNRIVEGTSVPIGGTPLFTFTGPAAPSITEVTVTALAGGNSRYTITGSNLLGGTRTYVARSSPCVDPENRSIEPGASPTQLTTVLPSCAGAHQIVVVHNLNYSVGDSKATAFVDLASRPVTVNPVAVTLRLDQLLPDRGAMNTPVTLRALGAGFVPAASATSPGSVLFWRRGSSEPIRLETTYLNSGELRGTIPAILMVNPQQLNPVDIYVENQAPNFCTGQSSVSALFNCARSNIRQFLIQRPTLRELRPNRAPTQLSNAPDFSVELLGDSFAPDAQVWWRPTAGATPVSLPISLASPTSIRVAIPANLLAQPRTAKVFVRNPAPTGATPADTDELDFTVFAPLRLDRLEPSSLPVGSPSTKVTAFGSGFTAATRIEFRDSTGARTPTDQTVNVQQGTIQFTLGADLLTTRKTWTVAAVEGTASRSDPINFEVTDGVSISGITPQQRPAGSGAFDLTIDGAGFTADAVVVFGTQIITPPAGNRTPTKIVVSVTAPAEPGKVDVKVRIGTGAAAKESNTRQIEFTATTPTITGLNPPSRVVNSGDFSLTITGTNFLPSPSVTVGGEAATISGTPTATSITVQVSNARIQTEGNVAVVVRSNNINSAAFNLQVTRAGGPGSFTLTPSNAPAGSGPLILRIEGTGLAGATVTFGGQPVGVAPGTTPTATLMQIQVPNSLLQSAGPRPVVVTVGSAPPVSANFTINAPQLPTTNISSGETMVQPNGNTAAALALASGAPVELTGTLELTFTPAAGVAGLPAGYVDPALAFVNGGQRRLDFRIPAAATAAVTTSGAPLGAINVGTVAGTVNVRVLSMSGAGATINVSNIAPRQITVPAGPPSITPNSARLVDSPGNVTVRLSGFAPTRAITQAAINFTIAGGVTVNGSTSFTVPLDQAFNTWFGSTEGRNNGSRFQLQIPFPVEGSTADITGFTISLTGPGNATSTTVTGTR